MRSRAMGPYTFVDYHSADKLTATISDQRGKRIRCSVANLLPLRAEGATARKLRIAEQPRPINEPLVFSSDSDDVADSDDEAEEEQNRPVLKRQRYLWEET